MKLFSDRYRYWSDRIITLSVFQMASASMEGISSDRVQAPHGINLTDVICSICQEILWKPVFCESCQTYFCSACIRRWLKTNPGKCPLRCDRYTEKPCARFVKNHLAQLQISCIYQSTGCEEIVSYEALEKHETQCDYRTEQCPGCHSEMLRKDLIEHEAQCTLIQLTCKDCNLTYLRKDADELHTEVLCLTEQLNDVRCQSHKKIKQLTNDLEEHKRQLDKLNQDCKQHTRKLTAMRKLMFESPMMITFDDIPDASITIGTIPMSYKKLRWINFSYMHEQYAKLNYPDKGYATVFTPTGSQYIVWSSSSASINVARDPQVFGIVSFEACAVYNDSVKLTIMGYRNSTLLYTHISTLLFGKLESIELCWTDIDTLKFESTGGTPRFKLNEGPHFLLTSITVTDPR